MDRAFPTFLALSALLASGCADDDKPTSSTPDKTCIANSLGMQSSQRLPVGEVLWLPQGSTEECADMAWALASGPGPNEVQTASSGQQRFTPSAVGDYTFESPYTDEEVSLSTIAAQDVPFHNLMYLPSASMAEVDGEVWVAEGYAPRIARMNANTGKRLGAIDVGPWPASLAWSEARGEVLVTHTAGDTLGVVEVSEGRLVDSIWVGDEPVEVVLSPDGQTAYVSLATEGAVAIVDLQLREVTDRIDVTRDPRALALSESGETLYVAGHRTGSPNRYPHAEDADPQTDIVGIDLSTGEQVFTIEETGNIIADIVLDESRDALYVSTTVSFPERGLTTLSDAPFEAQVQHYSLSSGALEKATVLQPSDAESGFLLGPQGMVRAGNSLWVVTEGSEMLVELNANSFAERQRISVPGAPRFIASLQDDIWVHASQTFEIHRVSRSGEARTTATGDDPRPAGVAAGQLHFVRPGEGYGQNFSCNNCHLESRGDTRVWQAGPFETWELTRPMSWLEGTAPLGWGGYVSSPRVFGYTGFTSIINKWPDAQMSEELGAFLSSIMPPPKANGWTQRDGSLSEEAQVGEALYSGKAGCNDCHALPLTTSNVSFSEGVTESRSSTPSLVGSYRHNQWLKDGSGSTLREAIVAVLEWTGKDGLSDDEIDSLTRYVQELTDRDFFLLSSTPGPERTHVGAAEPLSLTFTQPVWPSEDNLSRVSLINGDGETVPSEVTVDGRRISVNPTAPLSQGAAYTLEVSAGLEAYDQRATTEAVTVDFTTAAAPSIQFDGSYKLLVQMPMFDLESNGFDRETIVELTNNFTATASDDGADVSFDLSKGLQWETVAIFDGDDFEIPAQPVFLSNSLAQASAIMGTAIDLDGDDIADFASGTFTISGPGIWEEDIFWSIEPGLVEGACELGAAGDVAVSVSQEDGLLSIDWGEGGALGVYVTTYGATLPLGPGAVVADGDAFWALGTAAFPTGFYGPLVYGEVPEGAEDISEVNGAPEGGAELEEGACYQVSVISDAFQIGSWTFQY